jgi:hypothetical protein
VSGLAALKWRQYYHNTSISGISKYFECFVVDPGANEEVVQLVTRPFILNGVLWLCGRMLVIRGEPGSS